MPAITVDLEEQCVNTIKFLSADAVEKAKSGHPGTPMGAADMAYVLWSRFLHFDPSDPHWVNRDRFVLSAGHASMLLYSLLHLYGFDLPMQEIERFRQWGSRTPGHPEAGHTPGVEATTGPLGQGFGNGVGMALAQKLLRARLPNLGALLDHRVFGIVSDGDLMEGVASEAASLAGYWGLGNLVYLYDDNHISIEGSTGLAFTEDVQKRFDAYGWWTRRIDGNDRREVERALADATAQAERPSLILARTIIAKGAPTKAGSEKAHGEPLGEGELRGAKEAAGWPTQPPFHVPDEVRASFAEQGAAKTKERAAWEARLAAARREHPDEAATWDRYWSRELPADLVDRLAAAASGAEPLATRAWSGKVIQAAAAAIPSLVGGSADLGPSTNTDIQGAPQVERENLDPSRPVSFAGRTLHFGVREHAMGTIVNGLAYYGAFIPYGATFLVFSDYMRPAIRIAALTGLRSIFLFTHDSVFLGEDGPTHQPIEQAPALRLMPNLHVWRPADGLETAMAWAGALTREGGPTALLLTRQKLAPLARPAGFDRGQVARGGYILAEAEGGKPNVVLVATGSEVPLAAGARSDLSARGIRARVVSIPCVERFEAEPESYRRSVLPDGVPTVVIEAARTEPWAAIVGKDALRIGLSRYGASAPADVIAKELGFTPDAVAARVARWLERT
ncbi:MAG TPA: transketolase [Candidatus Binatia bacterium]|nr:transketolase [Candidatus Binatia bacterium]